MQTLSGVFHEIHSCAMNIGFINLLRSLAFGSAMLFFTACSAVGPDYVRPDIVMPKEWNAGIGMGISPGPVDPHELAGWWSTLNDPVLSGLMENGVKGNSDLRKARARVREARARRGISKAGLFPSIDTSGSITKRRGSEDTGSGNESELYDAGFDAGWELDVFGGVRRSIQSAEADLMASEEDLHDVLVTLLSEIALNYIEVRSFQARMSIAVANLELQTETYEITQWRFQAGLITQLDVEQARYNLEQTKSEIPSLHIGLKQAENRIALLLGKTPGSLNDELAEQRSLPSPPAGVAVGIPADILRQRPDIRRAERQLASQTAKVGAATAELYPHFNLTGSIGLEALTLNNLFRYGSRSYRVSPGFSWNIFDAGSIRQNIEVQNALQEQAMIQYEQTVLAALEDVENALVSYYGDQERMHSLEKASQASQLASDIAQIQYASGLIDFQTVLTAQRSLLSLQDQLEASRADVTSNLVRLYKALGGGWTTMANEKK